MLRIILAQELHSCRHVFGSSSFDISAVMNIIRRSLRANRSFSRLTLLDIFMVHCEDVGIVLEILSFKLQQ